MAVNIGKIATPNAGAIWKPEVGESIRGTITLAKLMPPSLSFDKTKHEIELRIDIVDEEGERWSVWAVTDNDVDSGDGYPSRLARAIARALSDAGTEDLEEGGTIAIVRTEDGDPPQVGMKAPWNYEAAYEKPRAKATLKLVDEDQEDREEEAMRTTEAPVQRPPVKRGPSAKDLLG